MDRPPPLFTTDISLFLSALRDVDFIITYKPLKDEQDPMEVIEIKNFCSEKSMIELPFDKEIDPIACAEEIIKQYSLQTAVPFIPGQKFDAYGTRHGRGGGWYDRFLSRVPRNWTRVGLTDRAHFSEERLERKRWDEPMDWIVMFEGKSIRYIKTNSR